MKLIKSSSEVISLSAVFMNYWAGLHNSADEANIKVGVDNLLRLAAAAAATSSTTGGRAGRRTLTITDVAIADPEGENMETGELTLFSHLLLVFVG
jgi:hypothetical protein